MDPSTTPQHAVLDGAPRHRDAQAPADYLARAGIADWQRYLAGGGEIQSTVVEACDACGAVTEAHVIGPYGGVLAFCVDVAACERRLRMRGATAPPGRFLNATPLEHSGEAEQAVKRDGSRALARRTPRHTRPRSKPLPGPAARAMALKHAAPRRQRGPSAQLTGAAAWTRRASGRRTSPGSGRRDPSARRSTSLRHGGAGTTRRSPPRLRGWGTRACCRASGSDEQPRRRPAGWPRVMPPTGWGWAVPPATPRSTTAPTARAAAPDGRTSGGRARRALPGPTARSTPRG